LDVSRRGEVAARGLWWNAGLAAVVLLAFVLRLNGIHNPILDHPGWRQGDTAAIARNFARLDFNPFHPQTDYDGPPPNYVELELQIVPFLAAAGYKLFGIHEVFGRLISIVFSLGTVATLGYFARYLFASELAGLVAALLFAIYPGSTYYGRTFTPDTTMVFFLTAALYASARWILERDGTFGRAFWGAALLSACALLAKPVAIVGLVPIAAMLIERDGFAAAVRRPQNWAFFALALVPYLAYDRYVASIAEWHWASGITRLHVLPGLRGAFASFAAFRHKFGLFRDALGMLAKTMLGWPGFALFVVSIFVPVRTRSRALLYAWLAAALLYAYVVVTVERVDYYLYVFLPLAALWSGGLLARAAEFLPETRPVRISAVALGALAVLGIIVVNRSAVRAYYHYNPAVYRAAKALDATLAPDALVVMGHYDPSILYYIDRKGWEEDPYIWTPFDEESAIGKGARYFIAIENRRLKRNVELSAWLERFPVANPNAKWPVYETDYAKELPGAEARWQEFRRRERAHLLPARNPSSP
jgi:hypothetical protein